MHEPVICRGGTIFGTQLAVLVTPFVTSMTLTGIVEGLALGLGPLVFMTV
jgi:hypothetical protein